MKSMTFRRMIALFALLLLALSAIGLAAGLRAQAPLCAGAETEIAAPADEAAAAAETAAEDDPTGAKAIAAGIAIGLAAAAGAVGMGIAIAKSNEAISRQPEADGKIRSTLMLGLILIETAIIYALVISILIIFAL